MRRKLLFFHYCYRIFFSNVTTLKNKNKSKKKNWHFLLINKSVHFIITGQSGRLVTRMLLNFTLFFFFYNFGPKSCADLFLSLTAAAAFLYHVEILRHCTSFSYIEMSQGLNVQLSYFALGSFTGPAYLRSKWAVCGLQCTMSLTFLILANICMHTDNMTCYRC